MTFYEAALEVLRRNDRPLHFKKITEISIREQLLSHIGRDPATVMVERLQKDIERGEDSCLLEPRRGVFDLKSDARNRLNREAELRKAQEASLSDPLSGGMLSRRVGGSGVRTSGRDSHKRVEFDAEALKNLSRGRYDAIEDAAYAVLQLAGRTPVTAEQLSDIIFNQKLIKFHTHDPEATLRAALVTANQLAARRHKLPPFESYTGNRWGLSEWGISDASLRVRHELDRISAQIKNDTEKQLLEAITTLKPEAFEMVIMTLLDLLSYTNVKVSKRAANGDVLFTADWTGGFATTRVCINIVNNHETVVDDSKIKELRDDLPHYNGKEGIIIHLGTFDKNAVEALKAAEKNAANSSKNNEERIILLDAETLVSLLVRHGIGVKLFNQPIVMVDRLFFDTLS